MKILILTHQEVEELLPVDECIPVMSEALSDLARGRTFLPLRMVITPPGAAGDMAVMPAYRSGDQAAYGVKVVCFFPGNPSKGLDSHQGSVMLFSGETGELLALMNASAITAIRTAAVSGAATKLLARENANELAIIGSGVQARAHLAAMACVRKIKRARVASLRFDNAKRFAAEFASRYSFPIEPVESVEQAISGADLIVTATTAETPILKLDWISAGAHLNVVGSSIPRTREIDSATIAAASLFVDRRESTMNEGGDYLFALREGAIGPDHIKAEIGELLIGSKTGRTSDNEITIFKSLGLAVEDLASAGYLYQKAQKSNKGAWVEY
ncbi:MAG TPA: ornithine cyclodeaminase family protein [Blastocatellia bacterium]|nr:ornithine cyclodeaminase family protein [Blastocatellia bacterium]